MNNIYTVTESAEIIAESWVRSAEKILMEGRRPLKLSLHEWHQLAGLAPMNRRSYSPRTWSRVKRIAIAAAKTMIASGRYPLCLKHFLKGQAK